MAMTRTRLPEVRAPAPPTPRADDWRAFTIPWKKVAVAVLVAFGVIAAWVVTTNSYSVLWQQHLTDRWAETVAAGEPLVSPDHGEPVARLSIPSLGIERVILEGVDRGTLRKAPGHQPGTPLPGAVGNSVVRGHRLLWSAPFGRIGGLSFGAPIYVQTADGSVRTYLVAGIFRMDPSNPDIVSDDEGSRPMLTLVTSDPPFRADGVLVVKAVMPPEEAP